MKGSWQKRSKSGCRTKRVTGSAFSILKKGKFVELPSGNGSITSIYVIDLLHLTMDLREGELPDRKVGRKWITTKAAVLRWIEGSSTHDTLTRAIERGDRDAQAEALNSGNACVWSAE
jgi:hypothetical protein